MYAQRFGLQQLPFSIAPDPRYLFMSQRHREALAHLRFGAGTGGGFVVLTGEVGAGKTTVCRCFLDNLPPLCNVAYVFNPKLTVHELLKTVCDEFGVACPARAHEAATVKDYIDPLNAFLLQAHAEGRHCLLIIDEAQQLAPEVLEQLRLLTNLETSERKLLQIILIGQPELRDMLARPELESLAQRVIARFHLGPLSLDETAKYIRHRLAVAGLRDARPFERAARKRVHQLSGGIPRRINLLCDRALLGAFAQGRAQVDVPTVERAAREVFGPGVLATHQARGFTAPRTPWQRAAWVGFGVLAGAALAGGASWLIARSQPAHKSINPVNARPPALAAHAPAASAMGAAPAPAPAPASPPAATTALAAPVAVPVAPTLAPPAAASTAPAPAPAAPVAAPQRNEQEAWRELAAWWGVPLPVSAIHPCDALAPAQLQCFQRKLDLGVIRQLNRPGFLTLHDGQGQPAYALLTGLGPRHAQLRMGGVTQKVALSSLTKLWRGEFATLWLAPVGYTGKIERGQGGPVVDALATGLAALNGDTAPRAGQRLDATLQSLVSGFQLAQGLKPDGVAGPTTFMQLNRASGVAEPRLAHLE